MALSFAYISLLHSFYLNKGLQPSNKSHSHDYILHSTALTSDGQLWEWLRPLAGAEQNTVNGFLRFHRQSPQPGVKPRETGIDISEPG